MFNTILASIRGSLREQEVKYAPELNDPEGYPGAEELKDREAAELESWSERAYRWRRARSEDPAENVLSIYPMDLAHFTGALIEEVLELKSRVEELEKQKAPSNMGEGQS